MTVQTDHIAAELPCHICGYDLRAHPDDGKCPECGASVAEARRVAAIPARPAWRDSDPRWRRRMLTGAWILVFLPLMDTLQALGWASNIPVPAVFDFRRSVSTLDETLLNSPGVYEPLIFCIGVVLLFSKEHERRRGPLDWTRRWGVLCTCVVLILSAAEILFIGAWVTLGVGAIFMDMPPRYQPGATRFLVSASTAYVYYGPNPGNKERLVLVAFSSIVILLACIPLFDALRSSGPKRASAFLLAPLASFALMHLLQVAEHFLGLSVLAATEIDSYAWYFWNSGATYYSGMLVRPALRGLAFSAFLVELVKWCVVLTIAIWLSIAQLAAWRNGRRASEPPKKRSGLP